MNFQPLIIELLLFFFNILLQICFSVTLTNVISQPQGFKHDAAEDESSSPAATTPPISEYSKLKVKVPVYPPYAPYSGNPSIYYQQQPAYYHEQYSGYYPYTAYNQPSSFSPAQPSIYSKLNEVPNNYAYKAPVTPYQGHEKDARTLSSNYDFNPEDSSFQYS